MKYMTHFPYYTPFYTLTVHRMTNSRLFLLLEDALLLGNDGSGMPQENLSYSSFYPIIKSISATLIGLANKLYALRSAEIRYEALIVN